MTAETGTVTTGPDGSYIFARRHFVGIQDHEPPEDLVGRGHVELAEHVRVPVCGEAVLSERKTRFGDATSRTRQPGHSIRPVENHLSAKLQSAVPELSPQIIGAPVFDRLFDVIGFRKFAVQSSLHQRRKFSVGCKAKSNDLP